MRCKGQQAVAAAGSKHVGAGGQKHCETFSFHLCGRCRLGCCRSSSRCVANSPAIRYYMGFCCMCTRMQGCCGLMQMPDMAHGVLPGKQRIMLSDTNMTCQLEACCLPGA